MASLATALKSTDHEFSTLLRFLDAYAHRLGHHDPASDHFLPRFDVEEYDTTYEVYGELAGARPGDIVVEARDNSHVEVRGRILRSLGPSAPPLRPAGSGDQAEQATSATQAGQAPISTAAVGDGEDGQGKGQGQGKAAGPAPAQTPTPDRSGSEDAFVRVQHGASTTTAAPAHLEAYEEVLNPTRPLPGPIVPNGAPQESPPAQSHVGRLITERHVGEFSRSFHFPTPIKPDEVKAWMENGVLRVTIPRAPAKPATKVRVDHVYPEYGAFIF